ncbi:medium-chain acyl-CoA ligase ACSF2, mitochondrial-like isoform X2 [Adelges cooleyi]|nr:medium-chain acyl-CoA ligase ACSF2, mitochondrial-like isoform X2 [Adelges cooleyi]XP_050435532.1 medium-chain acyl-CoA ligase ACSF2, mitochondrial-like isoform X2 [Adelges cooleyi]XP_050435533.1 medium-chain acyl-CoA ligase ACSF2, mitochondrial-like isoform X2 [Adelges cooleyi]
MTVGQMVDIAAEAYPNREAIVSIHQNRRITFHELKHEVDELAAGLLEMGMKPGDRLCIMGSNSVEWEITLLAAIKAGLIAVNINPLYMSRELHHCLEKVDAKMLIAFENNPAQDYYQLLKNIVPEIEQQPHGKPVTTRHLPHLEFIVMNTETNLPGIIKYWDVCHSGTTKSAAHLKKLTLELNPHKICNIQFTSGTTGTPKGACLTHYNIVNNSYFYCKRMLLKQKEHRILLQVPFFHTFGTVVGVMASLNSGSTLVLPTHGYKPIESAKAIVNEKCTILYGTPTMYVDLLCVSKELIQEGYTFTTPEVALCAGALCSPHLFKQIKTVFNLKRLVSIYGMTEASPIVFLSNPDETEDQMCSTVGQVLDHCEAKVVDKNGDVVPMGTPGEVWFKGYNVMPGYWNDEEMTKKSIVDDEWLRSGDILIMSEDGYGVVTGRIKDIIIRGGENIQPQSIEYFLETHPEIVQAQVFGIPDERLGEVVCAAVKTVKNSKLDENSIKNVCNGNIARFKVPNHVMIVDDFPKTVSGKIQKFKLREMMIDHLNGKHIF